MFPPTLIPSAYHVSFVHLYFVVDQLKVSLQGGQTHSMSCPLCQNGTISFSIGGFEFRKDYSFGAASKSGMKNGYAPLLDGDGEPRVSTDERASGAESMV